MSPRHTNSSSTTGTLEHRSKLDLHPRYWSSFSKPYVQLVAFETNGMYCMKVLTMLQRAQPALQSLCCQQRARAKMQTCQCFVSVPRIARDLKGVPAGTAPPQPSPGWNTPKCHSCGPMCIMSLVSQLCLPACTHEVVATELAAELPVPAYCGVTGQSASMLDLLLAAGLVCPTHQCTLLMTAQ